MAPDIVWARLEEVLPLCPAVKLLFYCVPYKMPKAVRLLETSTGSFRRTHFLFIS